MATLLDVPLTNTTWTNVYAARGLVGGEPTTVQNKTSGSIILYVGVSAPVDDSGMIISGNDFNMITIAPTPAEFLFAKSISATGKIGIQR